MNALTVIQQNDLAKLRDLLALGVRADAPVRPDGPTLLAHASGEHRAPVVQLLLEAGADANAPSADGWTPLAHAAAGRGAWGGPPPGGDHEAETIRLLVEAGANVDARNRWGWSPRMMAVAAGRAAAADVLERAGASAEGLALAALFAAIRRCDAPAVADAVRRGADVNGLNCDGTPALVAAASACWPTPAVALALIGRGADVNAPDPDGYTALMRACLAHELTLVHALLGRGAAADARNRWGSTSLHLLLGLEDWETDLHMRSITRLLIAAGADVNLPDGRGDTPLAIAWRGDWLQAADVLLRSGANIEEAWRCQTRDALAARAWKPRPGDLLRSPAGRLAEQLKGGIDVNGENGVLLRDAARRGDAASVAVLLRAGADPDAGNGEATPLMLAAEAGSAAAADLLLTAGAAPAAVSRFGETALKNAAAGGHADVVRRLVSAGLVVDNADAAVALRWAPDPDALRRALGRG